MNYNPVDIANWFLYHIDREAGDLITNLKLQKLVYYAQAWAITTFNEPLFDEDFQAWAHGPVVCSLFDKFKSYGCNAIPIAESSGNSIVFPTHIEKLLQEVLDVYGKYGAKYLEMLTHQEPPWLKARGDIPPEAASSAIISKDDMKNYYSSLLKQGE